VGKKVGKTDRQTGFPQLQQLPEEKWGSVERRKQKNKTLREGFETA